MVKSLQELPEHVVKAGDWDEVLCDVLIDELWQLRESMLEVESQLAAQIQAVGRDYRPSARNLAHYLALRQKDHRLLQERLAVLGVSSLGRAEAHVLANLDKGNRPPDDIYR
jgi:pyruvate kinase